MAAVRSHAALFVCALLASAGLFADGRALAQSNNQPTAGPTYYPPPPAYTTPPADSGPPSGMPQTPGFPPSFTGQPGAPVAPLGNVVPGNPPPASAAPNTPAGEQNVVEVRVVGNRRERLTKILGWMKTKAGHQFDQATLNDDVGQLARKGKFLDVKARKETVPGGVVVTIEIVEQPVLEYTRYLGNRKVGRLSLAKHTDLKKGDPLIPADVEAAKQKLEDYYREKGFNDVQITILEGNRRDDHGAVFLINEGPEQKIGSIHFVGNTIASEERLKTQVSAKPPKFFVFGGQVDQKKLAEDLDKLTTYYRDLGYFRARIGRETEYNDAEDRLAITYVIDEGPRARIRSVQLRGVTKFDEKKLMEQLSLKENDYYDHTKLQKDNHNLIMIYGGQGFCFADISPEPRVLEDASALDLVFNIHEGARYRISRVNVHIKERDGGSSHTRQKAILNRLALRPGDLIDVNKVDASKRKLRASNLFANSEDKGGPPRIEFHAPGENLDGETVARKPKGRRRNGSGSSSNGDNARMQSPDPEDQSDSTDASDDVALRPGESVSVELEAIPARGNEPLLPIAAPMQAPAASNTFNSPPAVPTLANSLTPVDRRPNPGAVQWRHQRMSGPPPVQHATYFSAAPDETTDNRAAAPMRIVAGPSGQVPAAVRASAPSPSGVQPASFQAAPPPQRSFQNFGDTPPQRGVPASGLQPNTNSTAPTRPQASASPAPNRLPFENYAPAAAPLQTRLTSTAQTASAGLSSATSQAPTGAASGPSFIVRPANANSFSTPSPEPPGDFAGWEWKVWSPSPNWPSDFQPRSLLARKNELPRSIVFRGQDPGYGNPAGQGGFNPQNPGSVAPPPAPGSIPGGGLLGGQPMPPYAGGPAGPSASVYDPPDTAIPIDVYATETQTGRFMFGAGVNSNAGLIGNITIDEQNFDWTKVPTSWEELRSGRAWRGAGQRFNISMAPGTIVQNYSVNFAEPYLLDTPVGFSIGGNYFNRYYQNWTETRAGGRLSLMYQFTPDLSGSIAFSGYDVKISNPSNPQEPELARVLGWSTLLGATASMTYDTRDSTFLATEGYYIGLSAEQAFGTFVFPRATADVRRYIKLHERPDGSGRHVVMLAGLFGIEGNNAPLYEHFFAGGIGSIRGFYFRGASTVDQGVIVGGTSQALGTVEYLFPLTADDMLRGTIFCDAGVIENGFDYAPGSLRVAPGAGLLIAVPALGPAPINVGIAIPVVRNPNDMLQYFYFSMGFGR